MSNHNLRDLSTELTFEEILEIFALKNIECAKDLLIDLTNDGELKNNKHLPNVEDLVDIATNHSVEIIPEMLYEDMNQNDRPDSPIFEILMKALITQLLTTHEDLRELTFILE